MRRKIEITFETAQFDCGKLVRGGVIENRSTATQDSKCRESNRRFRAPLAGMAEAATATERPFCKLTASDLHV